MIDIYTMLSIRSVFFLFISLNITNAKSPCKTPDNGNGKCIGLQQCSLLFGLLKSDITPEQRTFLRNSQCGRDGETILVCCPNTFTLDDLPSTQYCGKQVGNKIEGDGETTIYESPWMALLHYTKPNRRANTYDEFFCDGALINENYVMTAAHCVRGLGLVRSGFVLDFVRLGEHDLQSNPDCQQGNQCADPVEDVLIAEVIVHEGYNSSSSSQEHDLALIRLARAVPYTDFIRPICLPIGKLQNRNYDQQPMIVTGFGKTATESHSKLKLKVAINGVKFTECARIYGESQINLTESGQMCAGGEEGSGTCKGDAGAPLVAEEVDDDFSYVVGITSFGTSVCGISGFPDVFIRVENYIDWILDHMKK